MSSGFSSENLLQDDSGTSHQILVIIFMVLVPSLLVAIIPAVRDFTRGLLDFLRIVETVVVTVATVVVTVAIVVGQKHLNKQVASDESDIEVNVPVKRRS